MVEKVLEVAERRGVPAAQVALAWLLAQPAVTSPIVGRHAGRITWRTPIAAVDWSSADEEIAELGADYVPHAIAGHR